jgi:hypothetical protein
MTAAALVDQGEKLEVDLIEAPGEVNYESLPVLAGDHPRHEAFRQTPFDQVGRPCMQPVLVEVEVSRDDGPRRQQRDGKRLGKSKLPVIRDGEKVDVR